MQRRRLAFDMFSALFYGTQMKTTSPSARFNFGLTRKLSNKRRMYLSERPEDLDFVQNTVDVFRCPAEILTRGGPEEAKGGMMGTSVFQPHLKMGIFRNHPLNKKFKASWHRSYEYSCQMLEEALEKFKDTPADTKPYIVRVIGRQSIPVEGIKEVAASVMLAGIDTTTSVISWNLLYLAMNPEKQEILRKELREVLGSGDITEEIAANMKSKLPYLRAVIRETHRVAPATPIMTQRPAPCDVELAGYSVPEGTPVGFNVFSVQNNPKYVEDPSEFKPERWLADAVEARRGTEAEVIDDKLLATPFSFGARMCLGGRVADLELSVAIARLVRDWRISVPAGQPSWRNLQPLLTKPHPFPSFSIEAA
ncbi:Cyp12b2 [Symbiodinium natans]|uniref:Cyp12b2 protein n=1 Tax=Symbiodinium natans TaxID=878477 RepID=A0A812R3A5_9DINO|nr:Cyp12b2 [Symbiodinium natans]